MLRNDFCLVAARGEGGSLRRKQQRSEGSEGTSNVLYLGKAFQVGRMESAQIILRQRDVYYILRTEKRPG